MKCLVTGGAGFIGSHIAEALVKRGDSVRIFDNLSTGNRENLSAIERRIDFVQGDLRDAKQMAAAVQGIEVVFHQGALRSVPRSVDDPLSTHEVNITGTLQLLLASRAAGVRRVVYASSSSVYGDNKQFPQKESFRPSPISPYAVSKLTAELYCVMASKTFGLETVSLRYFNVFGPRQHPESQYAAVVPKFMEAALQGKPLEVHWDGLQSRDFTYIGNVVQANLAAAERPDLSGETFNVANGKTHSLLQMIRVLEKIIGHPLERHHTPIRQGDIRKTWADIGKAKRLLKYRPSVGLEDGLRLTWEWFTQSHSDKLTKAAR